MSNSEEISSDSWRALPTNDRAALVRKVLLAQRKLDSAIRTLSDYRKPEASATARQSIDGIRDFFSAFLASKYYPEQHAVGAPDVPHRIWQIPSLVEYMLSFAEVADLFTIRQVNKTLRNQVDTAELLQHRTCRSPNLDGHFQTAFTAGSRCSKLTGITVDALFSCNTAMLGIEKPPGHFAAVLEVRYDTKHSKTAVPNKYYPYGGMYLSQPPPTEIDVFPDCCSRGTYSSTYAAHNQDPLNAAMALGRLQPVGKVVASSGLTIGHLYDAIERIREEHRICPHALEILNHDDAGNYWPDISFGCLLKVRSDDPVLNPRVAAGVMSRTPPPAPNWKIWDYIDAKQKAYRAGRRIPTLAEFEASARLENFRSTLPQGLPPGPPPVDLNRMELNFRPHAGIEEPAFRPPTNNRIDGFIHLRPPDHPRSPSSRKTDSNVSGAQPSASTQRRDSTMASRPPEFGRASNTESRPLSKSKPDGPREHVFALAPKKLPNFKTNRRDNSKLGLERSNSVKRKKV